MVGGEVLDAAVGYVELLLAHEGGNEAVAGGVEE